MMPLGLHYWRILVSRWKLVLATVLACTLVAWGYSTFVMAKNPEFEAAARLNIVPTAEELGYASRFVRGSTFDGGSVLLGTYAEFAHTRPVVEPIVDRWIAERAAAAGQTAAQWTRANTQPPGFSPGRIVAILNYGEAPPVSLREQVIEAVIKYTVIENVEGTYLVRIAVTWDEPVSAAWFANALADAIVQRAERMSRTSGREIAGSLEQRLDQKQNELAAVLRQSRDAKSALGVVDIDQQKQALLQARVAEQAQLTTDQAQLEQSQAQVASLRRQSSGKLSSAQQVLEQTLAVEAPRASGLARGIDVRQGRIGQIEGQIATLARNEIAIKTLDDRARQLQAEVTALTERVSFSETENLANAPRIQLIERATPPLQRSSPKIFFNTILGFIAGCALAACLLLLLGPAPVYRRDVEDAQDPLDDAWASPPYEEAPVAPDAPTAPVEAEPVIQPMRRDAFAGADDDAPPPVIHTTAEPETRDEEELAPLAMASNGPRTAIGVARVIAPPPRAIRIVPRLAAVMAAARPDRDPPSPVPPATTEPAATGTTAPAPTIEDAASAAIPAPRMRETIDDPTMFPGILPRPTGDRYSSEERAALARRLSHWLMEPLADNRPLLIGATGGDGDSLLLADLVQEHLRAAGLRAHVVDATAGPVHVDTGHGKPIIVAGALDTPHRRATLGAFGDHGTVVVAVPIAPGEGLADTLSRHARTYRAITRRPVHVVAIGK